MTKTAVLAVSGLTFSYTNNTPVLCDVTLSVCTGEILTVLGPNGSGKSTLLGCIVNLLHFNKGEIAINGKNLKSYSVSQLSREIAYVPQVHSLGFRYSVRDYVVMGRTPYIGALRSPKKEDYSKADETISRMNISHLSKKPFNELSGGERQQVQIARALVQDAKLIILDEPTNHLDYGNQLKILQIIQELADKGYAVMLTTHMPDHVILLDGYTGILHPDGHMITGLTRSVITENNLGELYSTDLRIVFVEELGRDVCVAGTIRTPTVNKFFSNLSKEQEE